MLVQFTVENFMSIREEQTLSMIASNYDKDHPENVIDLDQLGENGVPGLKGIKLLKSAVIYGANASGKSNIHKAIMYLDHLTIVSELPSRLLPGEGTGVEPFLLDSTSRNKPTSFDIDFIHEGIKYNYGFVLTTEAILEEYLYEYPLGREAKVFTRQLLEGNYRYEYGHRIKKSGIKLKRFNEGMTRNNSLFLSMSAYLNDPDITPIYMWFKDKIINVSAAPPKYTEKQVLRNNEMVQPVVEKLLRTADLGITKIKISADDFSTLFYYENKEAGVFIPLDERHQSNGTLKYFDLLGPWLSVLTNGEFGYMDEIDTSLHPLLVRRLVHMFHDPKWNLKNSQILFNTHDTSLLSSGLFRRDQIWLTEKREAGNTELIPLSDFKLKKDESLQKGYLAGRYGAIPFIDYEEE